MSRSQIEMTRIGGIAGLIVAGWFPIFGAVGILLVVLGFEVVRLGDPGYVLPALRDRAWLIRFLALGNGASMLAGAVFAAVLGALAWQRVAGVAALGGCLAVSGWLVYLVGEASDQAAYLLLPFAQARVPEATDAAFVALQSLGRLAHAWGYLGLGVGTLALALALRSSEWPRSIYAWGIAAAGASIVLGIVELLIAPGSGDSGAGQLEVSGTLLIMFGATHVGWHGSVGVQLLSRARQSGAV